MAVNKDKLFLQPSFLIYSHSMLKPPEDIQIIGNELAMRWPDGREDFFNMEVLRAYSPSAENVGEADIMGQIHGGDDRKSFPGVSVTGWALVGNYAIQFSFSDGHRTGIYSFKYLLELGDFLKRTTNGHE